MVKPVGDVLLRAAAAGSLHARGDLITISFVWGSFEHPAQAVSKGQVRRNPPGILAKELVVIDCETALDRRALGEGGAVSCEIIDTVTFGENTHNERCRAVVVRTKALVHSRIMLVCGWIYVVSRIQGAGSVGDSPGVEIDRIGLNVGERVSIAGVVVANKK